MAFDEKLAARIRQAVRDRADITERKMFGGLSFLRHGRMCCGIVGQDLMDVREERQLKLDEPPARDIQCVALVSGYTGLQVDGS